MSFAYDEDNTEVEQIKAGEYEVYPTTYVAKNTQRTNNPMIVMNYKVRSDVDQPSQGALIQYDNFVLTKNSQWRFNLLTKSTELYENKHDFGTIEHWAEEMLGKPILVKVDMEKSNNGREYARVTGIYPSKQKPMKEQPQVKSHAEINSAAAAASKGVNAANSNQDPFAKNNDAIDISDDDLPF